METNSGHQSQSQHKIGESGITEPLRTEIFVAPGVPVVRGNTPKPLSLRGHLPGIERSQVTRPLAQDAAATLDFPKEAPSAPPLPEESEGEGNSVVSGVGASAVFHASGPDSAKATSEFVWLFEYGLGMNPTHLNSPERLNGLALPYGSAVLKGYRIAFDALDLHNGQLVANIRPESSPRSAVWGVLYRIPRRLTERRNGGLSMLDKLHQAGDFEPREVVVYDGYRKREIKCITYIASADARRQFQLLPTAQQVINTAYLQRLLACARQQKLPGEYLDELAQFPTTSLERSLPPGERVLTSTKNDISKASQGRARTPDLATDTPADEVKLPVEQNTEPLPVLRGNTSIGLSKNTAQKEPLPMASHAWMVAFALYVVLLFLLVLALSVLQALGFGSDIFTTNFAPLGTPWFVLVYGLLGGCLSGIITLGRCASTSPPGFVVITWFTRPFIGALLAALAYLALSSGFFVFNGTAQQHFALFSLVGALAGVCERWLFFRRT